MFRKNGVSLEKNLQNSGRL